MKAYLNRKDTISLLEWMGFECRVDGSGSQVAAKRGDERVLASFGPRKQRGLELISATYMNCPVFEGRRSNGDLIIRQGGAMAKEFTGAKRLSVSLSGVEVLQSGFRCCAFVDGALVEAQ